MKPRLHVVAPGPRQAPVVLEIRRVAMGFESTAAGEARVLADITFSVRRGEMVCILGRSGCGKTTLLKILAGFLAPTAGGVRLGGKPVDRPGPDRCVVFQEDALFPWLTVRENIAFGLHGRRMGRREKEQEIDRFLSLVGLTEFADYLPADISGGMKQRVSLARVLILRPEVLLMDEPFAALDAQTREEMQNLLLSLWAQFSHTVLFVTHDVAEAVLMADRILLLEKGPGRIREDVPIRLPRPRDRGSDDYFACCRSLTAKVKTL